MRRERQRITDVGGDLIVMPGDACSRAGRPMASPACGSRRRRRMDAAVVTDDPFVTDLGRAVDVLVEMKDISEVAVGLAYSAPVLGDSGLATRCASSRIASTR